MDREQRARQDLDDLVEGEHGSTRELAFGRRLLAGQALLAVKDSCGYYGSNRRGRQVDQVAVETAALPDAAVHSNFGTGEKFHYTLMGAGAVPSELRQAACWALETARQDLQISRPVQLFWISELDEKGETHLKQYPADRQELEVFELRERVFGLAVGQDKIFITARKCDPLEIIDTVVHEVAHLQQPPELRRDSEASEHDAKLFAKFFLVAFFGQLFQERRVYL